MKKGVTTILVILVALVVVNAVAMTKPMDCSYSNNSGSFTFEEMNAKERDFDMCQRKFAEFKKQSTDTTLYRLCRRNYWEVWNWFNFLFQQKFQLPFKSWKEIEDKRGPLTFKTGFQDF